MPYMCVMMDLQLECLPLTFRRRLGLQPQHFHVPQFGSPVPAGHSAWHFRHANNMPQPYPGLCEFLLPSEAPSHLKQNR